MIHKYQLNGYFIVLDVNSGAVHVVDELSYRLLDLMTDAVPRQCPPREYRGYPGGRRNPLWRSFPGAIAQSHFQWRAVLESFQRRARLSLQLPGRQSL